MKFKKSIALVAFTVIMSLSVLAQSIAYTVKSGDTFTKIAKKYDISVTELKQANPQIKDVTKIYVGQKITIPDASSVSKLESQVVTLVNQQRAKYGLSKLTVNSTLSYTARLKSQDMVKKNYFSHTSPTYGSPFKMMETFGIRFSAAGENIAEGQPSAQAVMTAWMNSPGHRANILSPAYNRIGVGCAKNSRGVLYWTQQFIKTM